MSFKAAIRSMVQLPRRRGYYKAESATRRVLVSWSARLGVITMASPSIYSLRKSPSWPVLISCRSQNWRMAAGRTRHGFRSVADGAGIARLRVMRTPFRRRMFCKLFATWAMPVVAVGRQRNVAGTQCDLPWFHPAGVCGSKKGFRQKMRREFSASRWFTNRTTVLRVRENWNSISRVRPGCAATKITAFKRWRSVF